jgi:hypothetical protein
MILPDFGTVLLFLYFYTILHNKYILTRIIFIIIKSIIKLYDFTSQLVILTTLVRVAFEIFFIF